MKPSLEAAAKIRPKWRDPNLISSMLSLLSNNLVLETQFDI
jgi:hypothetical protein